MILTSMLQLCKRLKSSKEFYNSNHNLEKDMDMRKRDRGSDDGASAESAHGEPVQKALKTD